RGDASTDDGRLTALELPGLGTANRRCDRESRIRTGNCSLARASSYRASSGRSESPPDLGSHCRRRDFRLFGDYVLCLRRLCWPPSPPPAAVSCSQRALSSCEIQRQIPAKCAGAAVRVK